LPPLEAAEANMKAKNMPDWLIGHILAIAKLGAPGRLSEEKTQPIEDIVGRPPLTTKQFVQDCKVMFS
jgi:hypothetical protein